MVSENNRLAKAQIFQEPLVQRKLHISKINPSNSQLKLYECKLEGILITLSEHEYKKQTNKHVQTHKKHTKSPTEANKQTNKPARTNPHTQNIHTKPPTEAKTNPQNTSKSIDVHTYKIQQKCLHRTFTVSCRRP